MVFLDRALARPCTSDGKSLPLAGGRYTPKAPNEKVLGCDEPGPALSPKPPRAPATSADVRDLKIGTNGC